MSKDKKFNSKLLGLALVGLALGVGAYLYDQSKPSLLSTESSEFLEKNKEASPPVSENKLENKPSDLSVKADSMSEVAELEPQAPQSEPTTLPDESLTTTQNNNQTTEEKQKISDEELIVREAPRKKIQKAPLQKENIAPSYVTLSQKTEITAEEEPSKDLEKNSIPEETFKSAEKETLNQDPIEQNVARSKATEQKVKRHFEAKVSPSNSLFKADDKLNKTSATIASQLNLGLGVSYVQHLTNEYHLRSMFNLTQMTFEEIDSRPLKGQTQIYNQFGLGLDRHYEHYTLRSGLGIKETPFIRAVPNNTDELEIKKLGIPHLSLGIYDHLTNFGDNYRLDYELSPRLLLPVRQSGIRTDTGYGLLGKVTSFDDLENGNSYFLGLGLLWEQQKSNIVDQNYMEAFLEFGFRWNN